MYARELRESAHALMADALTAYAQRVRIAEVKRAKSVLTSIVGDVAAPDDSPAAMLERAEELYEDGDALTENADHETAMRGYDMMHESHKLRQRAQRRAGR